MRIGIPVYLVQKSDVKKSINQSIKKSINQSEINQSTHQYLPTNEKQSNEKQSIKQPTSKSTIKLINQTLCQQIKF